MKEKKRKGGPEEGRRNKKSVVESKEVAVWLIQRPKGASKDPGSSSLLCLLQHVGLLSSGLSPPCPKWLLQSLPEAPQPTSVTLARTTEHPMPKPFTWERQWNHCDWLIRFHPLKLGRDPACLNHVASQDGQQSQSLLEKWLVFCWTYLLICLHTALLWRI